VSYELTYEGRGKRVEDFREKLFQEDRWKRIGQDEHAKPVVRRAFLVLTKKLLEFRMTFAV